METGSETHHPDPQHSSFDSHQKEEKRRAEKEREFSETTIVSEIIRLEMEVRRTYLLVSLLEPERNSIRSSLLQFHGDLHHLEHLETRGSDVTLRRIVVGRMDTVERRILTSSVRAVSVSRG